MQWDNTITEKYRDKSIQWADELVVGNTRAGGMELVEKPISHWEMLRETNLTINSVEDNPNSWAKFRIFIENSLDEEVEFVDYRSLPDMCIGVGPNNYNPWLIFTNRQDAVDYYSELNPTITYNDFPDDYSWNYPDINDDVPDDHEDELSDEDFRF